VIDTLVKDEHGEIVPYDFNGPSFVKWFTEDERKSFATRDVILVGVGGAGEAIARCVSHQSPNRLFLVDLTNKSDLVKELRADAHTTYCKTCDELIHNETLHNVLLINGTGHDGADSKGGESSLRALLDTHRRHDRLFVDLRPRLTVGLVEYAKKMGWESHSGFGMNARNDYEIWTKLVPHLREETMPFAAFRDLVREASG
jgi:shikimate 5-dehydrogenase